MTDDLPQLDSLIADFRLARKRLGEIEFRTLNDVRTELRDNVYPSMIAIAEQIAEVDAVIEELVDQQGSFIQSELAGLIFSTLSLGEALMTEVVKIKIDDEITSKRVAELVKGFRHSAELTAMAVQDAAQEEPGDGEDENEKTDPTEEVTPVEIPIPTPPTTEGENHA